MLFADHVVQDGLHFLRLLQQHHVTHLTGVPTLLRYLVGLPDAHVILQASRLQHVVSSGDVLTEPAAKAIRAALPKRAVLWNVYGCTETTADATCCAVTAGGLLT